jgi:arabinogalactan oligomer/maltooligosaccharide transport system permease protein
MNMTTWLRKMGWRHLIGIIAAVYALVPLVWVLDASLSGLSNLSTSSIIPAHMSLINYRKLLSDPNYPYLTWYKNTMMVAGIAAILQVMIAASAAYAFSRLRFRGRRVSLLGILVIQMFPQLLALVALYLFMFQIHNWFPAIGTGTKAGLILVYLGGAMGVNTYLIKGFFDTIPKELDDSAKVDGAGQFQTFRMIILPLAAPVLAVVGLLAFIGMINDFLIASVLLQDTKNYTLAVGLQQFVSGRYDEKWGPFAAGAILASIPVVLLFQFLQRYIVEGLTAGSVKG